MFHDDLDFIIFVIYWNIWFEYMEPTSIEDANELHYISITELIAEALDLNKVYNCPEGPDVISVKYCSLTLGYWNYHIGYEV
ncbi:hypothetical protein DTO164E3_2956 [Paecilomyces variotii]|nr:hypothetical protein DTO164E3_2956 [Paecilomyces variotii]KAJ9209083.1 hypothetical protein DTO032I3_300 [Paecilomyces variotii]KAJ9282963.1 hypothetical protein DTO021D3_300 [Paecilomyces variotii]KAJ9343831.1 hypothetical protein DTO027B6_3656 [Paecilomyces variotii]KAJ9386966.1 hypothetical protein DTO032I4_3410 [Paecilomyces variotii]